MNPSLAIVTTCKPFDGRFERIQRNALRSWSMLPGPPEVIAFGDEPGVGACCRELGLRHVPEVRRSEHGAPLLDGLFEEAERTSPASLFAFVNADVLLTPSLLPALRDVAAAHPRFLLIVRRWNLSVDEEWDFARPDWAERLTREARARGALEPVYGGIDLFAWTRGLWGPLPPFAIGRGRWDSALVFHARRLGAPVIDATEVVVCVHQDHDYSHHPGAADGVFAGPDAQRNDRLLGGEAFIFTSLNASHRLTAAGLRRRIDLYPPHLIRKLATLPALHPWLLPIAPLLRALAPGWRRLNRALARGPRPSVPLRRAPRS